MVCRYGLFSPNVLFLFIQVIQGQAERGSETDSEAENDSEMENSVVARDDGGVDPVDEQDEEETEMDDEEDWMKFQEEAKKENSLETKSKETHLVHCPYFPAVCCYHVCLQTIKLNAKSKRNLL